MLYGVCKMIGGTRNLKKSSNMLTMTIRNCILLLKPMVPSIEHLPHLTLTMVQLNHWAEYLNGVLNTVNSDDPNLVHRLLTMPKIEVLDAPPSSAEVHMACKNLKNNKVPKPDGIPGDVYNLAAMLQHIISRKC